LLTTTLQHLALSEIITYTEKDGHNRSQL